MGIACGKAWMGWEVTYVSWTEYATYGFVAMGYGSRIADLQE